MSDRQVKAHKIRSSRNSLDDRTLSATPKFFSLCDPWAYGRWRGNLRSNGCTTLVKFARFGSSLKNQLYGFT
ncbi:MAG: hypothetical protein LH628_25275, partial [Microcoleus sp. CAN_BIN18]|nr:hypothetical protein [Microcoleus sp. CAN_BIN18]